MLKEHIKNNYKSRYDFAIKNGISLQKVYYWCSKPWEQLSYKTKENIKKQIGELH